jgi:hypothetical protein
MLIGWGVLQVGLCDTEEQFNGAIIAGHDLSICILDVHCRFLLCGLLVCTLDVSWRCLLLCGGIPNLTTF